MKIFLKPIPPSFTNQLRTNYSFSSKDPLVKKVVFLIFIYIASFFTRIVDFITGRKNLSLIQRYKGVILISIAILGRISFYVVIAVMGKKTFSH